MVQYTEKEEERLLPPYSILQNREVAWFCLAVALFRESTQGFLVSRKFVIFKLVNSLYCTKYTKSVKVYFHKYYLLTYNQKDYACVLYVQYEYHKVSIYDI